ncbi:MAG TPA: hypothetical protein ENI45_02785, partial [Thermoplasmatales archaeon]|nr:hypothetical protein [Thermoplasmatales archaeon]
TYNLVDMKHGTFLAEDIVTHNTCTECVMPGTPISMADGTFKPIEEIKKGDLVKVFDVKNWTVKVAPVKHGLFTKLHDNVHEIHFSNGEILRVGDDHYFYTVEKGWANVNGLDKLHIGADKLSIGDHVYHTKPDGTLEIVKINNIVPVEGEYLTFDLANMKFHTYLVDDFVTHNTLCFMPGTPINLADGGYKNIEDVKVGDKVKVFNEKTGEIKDATVNCTQIKIHDNVYEIYLEDGRVLKPTANHPFWTKEKGWATISGLDEMGMGSGKLEIGDHLYSIQADGSLKEIKIVNIIPVEGEYLTYNFVDMKYGTFIADDIITHNTCCFLPGTKVNLANGSYKNVEDVKVGDIVKVFNEETGELEDAVVKVIHAGIHNDVYELYLNNGKILRPTANHPFWTEGKGWASISGEDELGIGADRLKVGDYIYQVTSNGNLQKVKVDAIIPVFGSYYSYNLINMSHGTFIAEDVITHNSCCFPAGTRIRMGDGTTKAIEDIKVGDRVLSYDVEHDRYVVSNVTKLIVKVREGVYDINNGLISPTCDHPLFVRKPNGEMGWAAVNPKQSKVMYKWRNAMPLQIGDQLFTAEGKWVKVYSIKYQPGTLTTYTFVVDAEVHDYFANNLLVSNTLICCFMPDTPITMADGTHKQIKDVKIGDKVKVFNEGNGTVEDASVKQMSMVMHDDVYELHLSNSEILRPTANHPFYTKEKGWATISGLDELGLGAGKLEIGDHVYQLSPEGNLTEVKIINIIPIQGNYLTYNLVDMKYGTFLADDIVTHNTCFLAGTNITMANGSFKRIEDVRVGDLVKAFDENTGRVVVSRVTKLYHHTPEEMSDYYLVVNDGLLRVTPEHMLYVDGVWRGAWTIKIGDNLLDINGSRVPVFSVKRVYRKVPTYNLEIERYHTFYANDVLVHNDKCFMPDTPITMSDGAHKPIKDVKIGDKVKVFNEEDMTVEDAPVTSIMTKMHNDVYEVYLSNGKILKPTANHPFWTKEKGWATIDGLDDMNIGAKKLEVGDHVYQLSSDETLEEVEVTNIVPVEGDYLTYNFVDMKYGTFLADDVVTHNTGNQAPSASYYDGATNIFAGKKVTTIRTEHTDPDGAGDVDDCRLRIGVNGGNYFTLNYNVDTNSYGCNNGCDWVSLSGCSVTETSITNGYRLTWQFIVDWDFPFDDTDYDVGVRTLDEQGADSGWQWSEAGTYTFENDLEVVSFTAQLEITDWDGDHDGKIEDNEWFAGGHPVAASGTVEYQGSSQTFDSSYASGVSVQLFYDKDGDGTLDDLGDSYDDTTISSGSFSIPTYTPGTFPVLQTNAHFDVAIQGIPSGGSDVTAASIEITSKRDNQPPPVFGSWTQDPDGDSGGDGYAPNTGYEDDSTCQGDFLECSDGSGSGIRYYYIKRNGGSYGPADADGLNVQCTLASGWNDIYYKLEDQVGNIAEGDTGENIYYGTTAPSDMDIDITGNVDGYPSSDPSWIIDKTDIPSGTLYINTDEPDQTWGITMDASGSWGSGGAWKVVFEAGWGASQKTDTSSPYTSYSYHSNTGSEPDIWTKIINNCGIVETVTLTTTVETTDPDTTVTDIPDGDTGPSTITGGSTDNLRVAAVKIYIKNTTDG